MKYVFRGVDTLSAADDLIAGTDTVAGFARRGLGTRFSTTTTVVDIRGGIGAFAGTGEFPGGTGQGLAGRRFADLVDRTLRVAIATVVPVGLRVDAFAVAKQHSRRTIAVAGDTLLAAVAFIATASAILVVRGGIDAFAVAGQLAAVTAQVGTTTGDALLVDTTLVSAAAAVVEIRGEIGADITAIYEPLCAATDPILADAVGGTLLITTAAMIRVGGKVDAFAVAVGGTGVADTFAVLTV